jgi:hypothetical protein
MPNLNFKLKTGDIILVDFDGIIVEDNYPLIGKVKAKTKKFLEKCRSNGIKVFIWSARCNNSSKENMLFNEFGSNGVSNIKKFLIKEKIYFTDILILPKPISLGFAYYLLDDRTTDNSDRFTFK